MSTLVTPLAPMCEMDEHGKFTTLCIDFFSLFRMHYETYNLEINKQKLSIYIWSFANLRLHSVL